MDDKRVMMSEHFYLRQRGYVIFILSVGLLAGLHKNLRKNLVWLKCSVKVRFPQLGGDCILVVLRISICIRDMIKRFCHCQVKQILAKYSAAT